MNWRRPHFLCPFSRFFCNPWHLSGVVFAMLMTNLATLMWAGIVLLNDDILVRSGSRYAFITKYVEENYFAAFFGALAIVHLICMWSHFRPTRFRNIGYGVLSLAWSFVFFYNFVDPGPIFATATSLSGTMAFIAFYAFLDGGAKGDAEHGATAG